MSGHPHRKRTFLGMLFHGLAASELWFGRLLQGLLAKEPQCLQLTHAVPHLATPLAVAHLSDLHAAAWMPSTYIDRIVGQVLAAKPDLVVWTGDWVHIHAAELARLMPLLEPLHRQIATYGVLGNHEYYINVNQVLPILRASGIQLLRNQSVLLQVSDQELELWGLDFQDTVQGIQQFGNPPRKRPRLLLCHQPDVVDLLPPNCVDLMLSGHLHHGQIRVPPDKVWYLPIKNGRRFLNEDFYVKNGNPVHTTPGLGYSIIPVRINCPPSWSLIRLQGSQPVGSG